VHVLDVERLAEGEKRLVDGLAFAIARDDEREREEVLALDDERAAGRRDRAALHRRDEVVQHLAR